MNTIIGADNKFFKAGSTVVIPATTVNFVATEKFVKFERGKSLPDDSVLIKNIGQKFWEYFLKRRDKGKIECPIPEQKLYYCKLQQRLKDSQIIAKFGGKKKVETTLAGMFFLVKNQKKGENGILLTDKNVNIFYIRDIKGVLRAVGAFWDEGASGYNDKGVFGYDIDGWSFGACDLDNPRMWYPGYQVFSRTQL